MWKWLRKLWKQMVNGREEKQRPTSESASVIKLRSPKVHAKSIYPRERQRQKSASVDERLSERRGPFRFPVIPDEPKQKSPVRDDPPTPYELYTRSSRTLEKGEAAQVRKPVQTEFLSPIYGRIEPKRWPDQRERLEEVSQLAADAGEERGGAPADAVHENQPVQAAFADAAELSGKRCAVEGDSSEQKNVECAAEERDQLLPEEDRSDIAMVPDGAVKQETTVEPKAAAISSPQPQKGAVQRMPPVPAEAVPTAAADKGDHASAVEAGHYQLPPLHLLNLPPQTEQTDEASTLEQKRILEETLLNFNVQAQVVGIVRGPTVTRFEVQPAPGVKVNKITGLADDIKLSLSAKDIRIEAPIPGRNAVGIEVPNRKSMPVYIRQIIGSSAFRNHPSPLAVALGMDIGGEAIVADIKKMPHGLIAGATGSGKSVCINSIIVSLLYKARPDQVRLLLIDPKMVELAPYNHLPHLVTPVVTDAKQATAALKWAVEEMERRYALFVDVGARDIERYNRLADEPLPYIVIIIDELADLMMVAPQDVEDAIIRIAQKARACGIHLLLATQRPSVDVITGNIKANVPTRLAFAVFSQVDSRTILDQAGAERLLGRGDMLFFESGAAPVRLQGNFVSDDEIERVTEVIKRQRKPDYLFTREELEQSLHTYDAGEDALYWEALVHVAEQGQASASALQRRFRIGYNRAARLIEMMEADGYVSGQSGGKPRTVLISLEEAKARAEGPA